VYSIFGLRIATECFDALCSPFYSPNPVLTPLKSASRETCSEMFVRSSKIFVWDQCGDHTYDATAVTFHFGPRFRPSGFAPPPPQWHPPQVPQCAYRVAQLHSIAQHSNYASFMFKLLFIANATRSPRYLRPKHGGVPHGPRAETEGRNDRIVAKIQTPFRPSERAPFPTPRIFATLCQISALGANSF